MSSAIENEFAAMGRAMHRAAGELPEGWELEITLERGGFGIVLYSPSGSGFAPELDGLLSDQINAAIDIATGAQP